MINFQVINNFGQLKKGDLIIIEMNCGKIKAKKVKEVINPNTENEEVIYNMKRNYYFLTKMLLDGNSFVKNVSKVY